MTYWRKTLEKGRFNYNHELLLPLGVFVRAGIVQRKAQIEAAKIHIRRTHKGKQRQSLCGEKTL
jgi:hypothetical protein